MKSTLPATISVAEKAVIYKAQRILRRHFKRGYLFNSPAVATEYMRLTVGACADEHFGVCYLTNKNALIANIVEFTGTLNASPVFPRTILRRAMHYNAGAVILYHNHPSSDPTPSDTDRQLTITLVKVLSQLDVRVIDHFIITATNEPYSLATEEPFLFS